MALSIYTDGSCKPNPGGEMRIGVVVMRGEQVVHSFARNMGMGTNNQAELLAVREALAWAPKTEEIVLHVDSKYALGTISKGWNATKNLELIQEVKKLFKSFPRIRMIRVPGHSGIRGNEMADALAA